MNVGSAGKKKCNSEDFRINCQGTFALMSSRYMLGFVFFYFFIYFLFFLGRDVILKEEAQYTQINLTISHNLRS